MIYGIKNKIAEENSSLSVITLDVNGLIIQLKGKDWQNE